MSEFWNWPQRTSDSEEHRCRDAITLYTEFLKDFFFFFPKDDLSSKKDASQIDNNVDIRYYADLAVDRNVETCTRTNAIGLSSPDKTTWWKVDLGRVFNIYSINILFKTYQSGMFDSNC